ncbi:MAG TPA: SRPBCC family protein [Hyphomicrobium sp.]|nr:SRPBCC family protein [Hyphomicrobium sp.]
MLKRILLAVAVLIAGFSVYVAMLPSTFRIERSTIVVAPAAATFAEVNDFHNWQEWSPWAKLDPNAKATFEGPASGEGAIFRWAGNETVGEGSMTLVESQPNDHIRIRVDFLKPWEGTNMSDFTFTADGPRTVVNWAMSGEQGFLQKAICVFMNPDKMVGEQFEKGLANLKKRAEGKAAS